MKETELTKIVQQKAFLEGNVLWRNNSGAMIDKTGRLVRFGLGNESKKVNDYFKCPDLVGIKTITITQEMIGKKIGVFYAKECKKPGWKYKGNDHEKAQKRFIDEINSRGGEADFICNIDKM